MPGWLDAALVVLFAAVWPLVDYFYLWPRHERAVDAGDPNARSRSYMVTLCTLWVFAAAVVAVMLSAGRPLSFLLLRMPHGWRLWLGATLAVVYLVQILQQHGAIARKPIRMARLRETLKPLRALVPHTPREYRLFVPLSITAGVCEELLFRGYLVWVLQHWLGLWAAAGASMVIFGLGHSYQGWQFGVRAFFAGVAMGVLALATGSLLPGIVMHALMDLGGGSITYMVMRESPARAPEGADSGCE